MQQQEFALGSLIRSLYMDPSSSSYIQGITNTSTLFNQAQVDARADAGGEGGVIFDSSVAMLQGLFPVTNSANTTLANGSTIVSPLGGYQYVPSKRIGCMPRIAFRLIASCTQSNLLSRTRMCLWRVILLAT